MQNIVLTGLPGCGKTTLGKIVSRMLCMAFVDMDERIEKAAGICVSEIFRRHGEAYFRDLETETARLCSEERGIVLATGGGAVIRKENMAYLRRTGKIIYIQSPPDRIAQTIRQDTRPLLTDGIDRLFALEKERAALYRETADVVFCNEGTLQQAALGLVDIAMTGEEIG